MEIISLMVVTREDPNHELVVVPDVVPDVARPL